MSGCKLKKTPKTNPIPIHETVTKEVQSTARKQRTKINDKKKHLIHMKHLTHIYGPG